MDSVEPTIWNEVEADSYWCLGALLEGIQDSFTFSQPGIQRAMFRLFLVSQTY